MSFHKRHLNDEIVFEKFKENGIKGIINYIGKAEALFTNSKNVIKIRDILNCESCKTKKELEIKKIIENELPRRR